MLFRSALLLFCLLTNLFSMVQATPFSHLRPNILQQGFVYCVNGDVNTFNPQKVRSGLTVETLAPQIYNRLIDIDPYTYRLIPSLATHWQISDNGTNYRFTLRKNVSFQQTPWFTPSRNFNADDVLFSFQRIFDNEQPYHNINGSDYPYFDSLQLKENIKSITRINDNEVEFRLFKPDASFLWHLATYYASILSAEYAHQLTLTHSQNNIDYWPVGTGPFAMENYKNNHYVRLVSNPHYWQGVPQMKQVIIDLGSGGTGRLSKLLTGECDVLAYPAASQLTVLRNDPRLHFTTRPGMNVAYLAFNTQKPPLNDSRVRQAIALAINNPRLISSIYYGTAETASSLLPRASWAFDPNSKISEYNPQKAKALLAQLGIKQLTLTLWVPSNATSYNPSPLKMAELLQTDLANIGVTIIIKPLEGRYQERSLMDAQHDLTLSGWITDSNDPDSFFHPLLSCSAINSQTNYAHWCNHEFDQLLSKGLQSQNIAERISTYHQIQRLIAEQIPLLPLASSLRIQAYRNDIGGLILSSFGNNSFSKVYRKKADNNSL